MGSSLPALGQSTNQYLHRNGVLVLPSALAAAGGVISASAEYQHIGMERAFSMVEARIGETTNRMIAEAHDQDVPIQELIERAAQDRLATSMEGQA